MRSTPIVAVVVGFVVALMLGGSTAWGMAASVTLNSQKLTPYRTCTVTATTATTAAVIDAVVRQATPTTNLGTATTIETSSANAANRRVYIKFDLSGCSPTIPSDANVRAATLRLYMSALPAACRTLDIFRVTSSWTETGITWNTQPFGTTLNNPATASRTDAFDVGSVTGCQNLAAGYVTGADVTTDVAAFVAGSATNNGWMIRDDAENSVTARTATFSAKNLGTLARAPQLIVTYTVTP
jgi:hypothetical protein